MTRIRLSERALTGIQWQGPAALGADGLTVYTPTVLACEGNSVTGTTLPASDTPAVDGGLYWLLRPIAVYRNQSASYGAGAASSGEQPGRDAEIGASAQACP